MAVANLSFFLLIIVTFSSQLGAATAHLNSTFHLLPGSANWTNNDISLPTTINFKDGSMARFILLQERRINSSSHFGFGFGLCFYCFWSNTNQDRCYLAIIFVEMSDDMILTEPDPQVVWSANRDNPVGENATLSFSDSHNLVLFNAKDIPIWSTDTSDVSVSAMRVNHNGNLVLFNSTGGKVWQSFAHLTDTLLEGQRFGREQRLISRISNKNMSSGWFKLRLDLLSLFAYMEDNNILSKYLSVVPNPLRYRFVPMPFSGWRLEFVELRKGNVKFHYKELLFGTSQNLSYTSSNSTSVVEILKLDSDGGVRVYGWEPGKSWQETDIFKDAAINECQFPLRCGSYGLCSDGGRCICPIGADGISYFTPINNQSPHLGCRQIHNASSEGTSQHYRLVKFKDISYVNRNYGMQVVIQLEDEENCVEACNRNSSCKAALFSSYGKPSPKGTCSLATHVFSLAKTTKSSGYYSSFHIKLRTSSSSNNGNAPASNSPLGLILSATFACVLALLMVTISFMLVFQKKKIDDWLDNGFLKRLSSETSKRFSYKELCEATNNFSELLGRGGFGMVFKGVLKNGTLVAVKRLDARHGTKEFLAEVETIGNLHHINLVRLIGFCANRKHRLLVYEYMRKGSMEKWVFRQILDWNTRKKIVIDIAKGLTYLHEECRYKIAHLDIKPHNILLDDNFNAKISDFGLSKLINRDQSQVVTGMRGTLGYLAPELEYSRISVKADVFSFGIMLLEIICGRKILDSSQPESDVHLLSLLGKKAFENRLRDMVDSRSEDMQNHVEEAIKLIRLGMLCSDGDYARRPSMSTVLKILEGWMPLELINNNIRTELSRESQPSISMSC